MDRSTFEQVYGKGTKLFDLAWFQKELPRESERGQAVIIAAFLEDMIARTLERYLKPGPSKKFLLGGNNAPLGTFAAKSAFAHVLGLINDAEYRNIELVRKIRNEFAHAVDVSFDEDRVSRLISSLDFAMSQLDAEAETQYAEPRLRYFLVAGALLHSLHDRCEKVEA